MNYRSLKIEKRGTGSTLCAWIWMSRAEVHNAFDEALILELQDAFRTLDQEPQVRAIVLAGEGKSFSAGADINWMRRQSEAPIEANLADAQQLANLFRTISECSTPTIARVHGAALGGGMGLACACDICIASQQARFATSEVKLGLMPSAIGPYVIRAIGERQAYRYFQTAEMINAARAGELGLAHEVVEADQLDAQVQQMVEVLIAGGPHAQAAATDLIRTVANRPIDDAMVRETARRIAELRATPEAKEGLTAFLEKRPASWTQS